MVGPSVQSRKPSIGPSPAGYSLQGDGQVKLCLTLSVLPDWPQNLLGFHFSLLLCLYPLGLLSLTNLRLAAATRVHLNKTHWGAWGQPDLGYGDFQHYTASREWAHCRRAEGISGGPTFPRATMKTMLGRGDAQWFSTLDAHMKTWVQILSTHVKSRCNLWVCDPSTQQEVGGQRKDMAGACWLQ